MSDAIVTSRRNFLKLFGAAVAVAAAPIPLVLVEQVVAPVRGLPPNVLHLRDGGAWKAISELRSIAQSRYFEPMVNWDSLGVPRKFKGLRHDELEIVGYCTPELVHLDNVLRMDKSARFAISVQGQVYEFDALMMQLSESYGLDNAPDFNATLGLVGEVTTYAFEVS